MALSTDSTSNPAPAQANVIIPKPLEYTADADGGTFSLEADSEIYVSGDSEVTEIAEYLQEEFGKSTGYELPVSEGSDTSSGDILLAADGDESLGEEGYTVTVGENGVKISAYTPHGIFNGVQTLRQLFPADIENTSVVSDVEWTASYCEIYDKPEYSYRGAMIDSARHFHSVESVKRQIDHMAKYKINKLHLRLADDQGWRLEIKGETETGESYDKLRTIGASTSCSTNGYRPGQYTQEEFRELAEYAADHYVEIIPEFDMPGHSWAALVSLEYLNSTEDGKPHSGNYDNTKPYDGWDVGFSTLECRNENTYKFIEDVISQVAPLYPSEYIHIGGDEAWKTHWKECPLCQARMKQEKLDNGIGKICRVDPGQPFPLDWDREIQHKLGVLKHKSKEEEHGQDQILRIHADPPASPCKDRGDAIDDQASQHMQQDSLKDKQVEPERAQNGLQLFSQQIIDIQKEGAHDQVGRRRNCHKGNDTPDLSVQDRRRIQT